MIICSFYPFARESIVEKLGGALKFQPKNLLIVFLVMYRYVVTFGQYEFAGYARVLSFCSYAIRHLLGYWLKSITCEVTVFSKQSSEGLMF